jgi:cobalt-zinc-cadmium efflux system outer membrane protein
VAWKEWQVAQGAKTAAYDVIAGEDAVAGAADADAQLARNLDLVREAVDRHDKTLLDLAAADAAWRDAHSALLDAQKELRHQRIVLNRSLGLAADYAVSLRRIEPDLPSRLHPPTTQQVVSEINTRRLDLVALRKGYESQDQTLRAAVLAQFPKISLGVTGARDTSNVKTIGIGATIDLPIFDRNQATIATESATRQKLMDEYVNRVFEARSDAADAIAAIESTNAQIAAAEAAMPARENLVKAYDASFGRHDVDALSYYTARGGLAQKRVELVKLKQQLMQNWIALELAAGRPISISAATTAPTTSPATREGER